MTLMVYCDLGTANQAFTGIFFDLPHAVILKGFNSFTKMLRENVQGTRPLGSVRKGSKIAELRLRLLSGKKNRKSNIHTGLNLPNLPKLVILIMN